MISTGISLTTACIGYGASYFGVKWEVFSTLNALPKQLQQLLSLEQWWLDKTVELSIPMFCFMALRLQLLKLDDDTHEKIVKILPWCTSITHIFISGLPLFLMATAGIWLGITGYLVMHGCARLALFLFIPIAIASSSVLMRQAFSINPVDSWFTRAVFRRKDGLSIIMVITALTLWTWVSYVSPLSSKVDLYQYAMQSMMCVS